MKKTSQDHVVFPIRLIGGLLSLCLLGSAGQALAVSKEVCVREQETFIQASIDNAIHPETRKSNSQTAHGQKHNQKIVDETREYALGNDNGSIGWHIAGTGNITKASDAQIVIKGLTEHLGKEQKILDSFRTRPWERMQDDRFSPETYQKYVAEYRMKICFFEVRMRELSGGNASAKPAVAPSDDCPAQNAGAANQAISDIDAQLRAFAETPMGTDTHTITPTMQVVMWATEAQADIIRKYCPNGAGFKERVSQLDAAFNGAKKACRQIQSNPEICVPTAPQELIASYDQAHREASNARPAETSSAKVAVRAPSDLCPNDKPIDDFMGCLKGRCLEQGFSPVETKGGCLICGNSEGDLGVGFQWRQCHKSSKGVGAAR